MKKLVYVMSFLILTGAGIIADEFNVGTIECSNGDLMSMDMNLNYNSDNGNLVLYDNSAYSIAYIFNDEARDLLLKAVSKAEEWNEVAIKNDIVEMSKEIPDMDDIEIRTMVNYGDGWFPGGLSLNYQFLIMNYENKIRYLFFLRSRTMDDLNNGAFGTAYLFDVGKQSDTLKEFFSDNSINEYKRIAEQNSNKDNLFD